MGKNGDQAQRMFQLDADVFIAQHWREIEPSVVETMRTYAVAKSIATGKLIRYGVIDGQTRSVYGRRIPKISDYERPLSSAAAERMTPASQRPRIYLAGPEVFLPDALAVGAKKIALCAAHGFEGVFPLDAGLDLTGLAKVEQARRIFAANESLIAGCDMLIANLTPFRGVSMDAGTAFEVGFMRALGRPVLGYTNVAAGYRQRAEAVPARLAGIARRGRTRDRDRGFRRRREPDDRGGDPGERRARRPQHCSPRRGVARSGGPGSMPHAGRTDHGPTVVGWVKRSATQQCSTR